MSTANPSYINDHSPAVLASHGSRTATNSAAYLLPYLRADMTILDIGCGPGSITIDLARLVPHGHVIGVEPLPNPLEGARARALAAGVSNVTFQLGDVHDLPFPDDTFDIVHAHQVLQHVPNPVHALEEMRRVTKRGGIVADRETAAMVWYPDSHWLEKGHEVIEKAVAARGGHAHPGRMIHVWAQEAGFARDAITKSAGTWCYATDDERKVFAGSLAQRMREGKFAKLVVDEGFATEKELEEMARAYDAFCANPDAWWGALHGEIVCRK